MKSSKEKRLLLEQLKKMPIIQIASERAHIARSSFYRWKKQSKEFARAIDEAIVEGETLITEMTESQLIGLIKDKNFPAIQLWLKAHHPKYGNKVEITGRLNTENEPLTLEQKSLIEQALKMAALSETNLINNNKNLYGQPELKQSDGQGSKQLSEPTGSESVK
ncbi:MAG: hypothetical protein NTY61_02030 [Candidatus Parcubacteria bacterium]|nr:hypothetical protein [Candidatus Parcubacteria bacterium]